MSRITNIISLAGGEEDKEKVLDNVRQNISFRGSNLWILACAIVVASVGLNVNSAAVIIGAMLISPLMGPIVGAGFSLGMFDFPLLKKSLKNLLIATVVSLTVSAIYFFISPFKEAQSELLARTAPNIYDILIAFFGGLVGVIAVTRVEKGNPIPGVAIATALMPPLCTSGYGLAIGNWKFFLGAFYLYTINCVFICIATFLIVKYLNYPRIKLADSRYQKKVTVAMTSLILIVMLPSIYFAYILFEEKKFNEKTGAFVEKEFTAKGYTILYKKTSYNTVPRMLELAFLTKKFSRREVDSLARRMDQYGISNTKLSIRQDTTDLKRDILNEINIEKSATGSKDLLIEDLKRQIQLDKFDTKALFPEIRILFPEIENFSLANHTTTDSLQKQITVMVYQSKEEISEPEKLTFWLEKRLNKKDVEIYRKRGIPVRPQSKISSKRKKR